MKETLKNSSVLYMLSYMETLALSEAGLYLSFLTTSRILMFDSFPFHFIRNDTFSY